LIEESLFFSLLKMVSIKYLSSILFSRLNFLCSKKKQTLVPALFGVDLEGIISKFVNKNQPTRVVLYY